MSNEELVEEILFESHSLGIYDSVMQVAGNIREDNPKMNTSDVFQLAFNQVKSLYVE